MFCVYSHVHVAIDACFAYTILTLREDMCVEVSFTIILLGIQNLQGGLAENVSRICLTATGQIDVCLIGVKMP